MTGRLTEAIRTAAGRWRWRNAHSLADLAHLQADRIARNLATAPDPDTWTMYSALVALGRAGVVVHDWRRGNHIDAAGTLPAMDTRACVVGFADENTKNRIDTLLYHAGKVQGHTKYEMSVRELYAPGCPEYDRSNGGINGRWPGHWVERIDGNPSARIGGSMTAGEVYRAFPTRPSVQAQLQESWLIGIHAPTWGSSRMYADLLELLENSPAPATADPRPV